MSGMKIRSLVVLSNHSAFHRLSAKTAAFLLLSSDELMSCFAAGTFLLDGQVSIEWSRCPGFLARHAGDRVASL